MMRKYVAVITSFVVGGAPQKRNLLARPGFLSLGIIEYMEAEE